MPGDFPAAMKRAAKPESERPSNFTKGIGMLLRKKLLIGASLLCLGSVILPVQSALAQDAAKKADDKVAPIPPMVFHAHNPDCEITIDTSGAPELKDWVHDTLGPTLVEWYPKIVAMLPSEDSFPPSRLQSISVHAAVLPPQAEPTSPPIRIGSPARFIKKPPARSSTKKFTSFNSTATLPEVASMVAAAQPSRRLRPDPQLDRLAQPPRPGAADAAALTIRAGSRKASLITSAGGTTSPTARAVIRR